MEPILQHELKKDLLIYGKGSASDLENDDNSENFSTKFPSNLGRGTHMSPERKRLLVLYLVCLSTLLNLRSMYMKCAFEFQVSKYLTEAQGSHSSQLDSADFILPWTGEAGLLKTSHTSTFHLGGSSSSSEEEP